jgi:hypothetical protein
MSSRDDILEGAVRQLREASNPGAAERARILAAVRAFGSGAVPAAPVRAPRSGLAATIGAGQKRRGSLGLLARGFALGLATFAIGVSIGVGFGFDLGRGSVVVPPPEPVPTPVQVSPAAAPAAPAGLPESRGAPALVKPAVPPPSVQRQPKPRHKPRARPKATPVEPASRGPLTLAEALELLHRAERAIYSDNAAWALSLLDQLDERAPRDMLHEERIATRIVAWCADGQVENAERLASQARAEAPTSIYGAILERACNGARMPAAQSRRP